MSHNLRAERPAQVQRTATAPASRKVTKAQLLNKLPSSFFLRTVTRTTLPCFLNSRSSFISALPLLTYSAGRPPTQAVHHIVVRSTSHAAAGSRADTRSVSAERRRRCTFPPDRLRCGGPSPLFAVRSSTSFDFRPPPPSGSAPAFFLPSSNFRRAASSF